MPRADFRFAFRKRVRYAEIDAQAVLFNSRYLEYFDIGAVEYWRAVGMYQKMTLAGGPEFHVAKAEVQYKAAILLDEEVDICVRCARVGRSSMTFLFEIHGAGRDDLRATGEEVQVHVAEVRGAPAPVPDWAVQLFETYERRALR
ncbi:acyl-CoA thioesterase [Sandaracinobacteroides saxicola]|uniref:Acyl-CoA thioesterase n=1 Tax=Sandaracinobacteroides saxicola TaxID=2759707 RepID=A0A7G5IHG1_9SPHN|nr:thioesterase family protein [Sandaracinobacteroides saxicola]QMW22803.1 acyl-CoA thioesterase [Sandaracinobacteroides saxicola]